MHRRESPMLALLGLTACLRLCRLAASEHGSRVFSLEQLR
jgi:hypothetical protein